MILESWLPEGGENLFQKIKAWTVEAEVSGTKLLKLSIGQPEGAALESARLGAAAGILSGREAWHEYQDNGCVPIPDFGERFFRSLLAWDPGEYDVDHLPLPGIKPMLGLMPLACGSHIDRGITVATMTNPGYPTPKDWCGLLRTPVQELTLTPENRFRFDPSEIDPDVRLIMLNLPHNPTGQIATEKWLGEVCAYAEKHKIRVFNDEAYISHSHTKRSVSLAKTAVNFTDLSWIAAVSASKVIGNGTGWRVGAAVGSPDFIADLKTIKGMTDSGFVAPMAAGVIAALENDLEGIDGCRKVYARRLRILIEILEKSGMRLAVRPQAGFFILCLVPHKAFGRRIESAEQFNRLMIERTGVVGVHFGEHYIRYSVTAPVEEMQSDIGQAFSKVKPVY